MQILPGPKRGRPRKLNRRVKRPGPGRPPKPALKTPQQDGVVLHYTDVWEKTIAAREFHTIVERGGARSSKSHSVCQILIDRLFSMPQHGRKILVMRKTYPSMRISVKPMLMGLIDGYGLMDRLRQDKMDDNLVYGKSILHFASLDRPEKIRSSEWNDVFMEEANEFTHDDYMNVLMRMSAPDFGVPNQLFLCLNPTDAYHWIKERLIGPNSDTPLEKDLIEIHSTYRDNPYLPESYVRRLEAQKEQNPNYWKVFGEGEWGKLENLVYTWWQEVPEPRDGETYYGLDFGFTNPSCLVECRQDGQEVYVIERLYQEGLTNVELLEKVKRVIPESRRAKDPIYPDVAEPARIKEFEDAGFWCIPSDKEVLDGIDTVKQFHLNVVNGRGDSPYASPNVLKEIRGYSYRMDRQGRVLEEPMKFNDHAMSAIRYAVHTHNKLRQSLTIRELSDPFSDKLSSRPDPWDPWAGFRRMADL